MKIINIMEIWKDIIGYEGLYQVSNFGNIKSLNYNHTRSERILKPQFTKGYLRVALWKDRILKQILVHRLVADSFIPNVDNKPEVDHINTIKTDNRLENLHWTTKTENQNNQLSKRKMSVANIGSNNPNYGKLGELSKRSIPIMQYSKDGEFIAEYAGTYEAQRMTGICTANIVAASKGRLKSAGGFIWKYKNK